MNFSNIVSIFYCKQQKIMENKFTVEVRLIADGIAVTQIEVTESEYKLLKELEEKLNDDFYQEAYSPNMYVNKK